jgi:hypothetical protein
MRIFFNQNHLEQDEACNSFCFDGLNSTATLLAGPIRTRSLRPGEASDLTAIITAPVIRTRSLQLGDKAEKAFIKNL